LVAGLFIVPRPLFLHFGCRHAPAVVEIAIDVIPFGTGKIFFKKQI
jgi:hypothetical protein